MRGRLKAMLRWWKESNGNGNGKDAPSATVARIAPPPAKPAPPPEPPWLAQLDREGIPRSLRYPTTTLGRIVDHAAERFGDVPALIYNNQRLSYSELLARINRMAGGLSRLGVRKGDRIILALPNCPEYVISFFAIQKLGAVLVNAGPLIGADDLRSIITLTTPRAIIGLDLQAPKIMGVAEHSSAEHFVWVTLQSYQNFLRRFGYQIKLWQGRERSNGSTAH